MRKLIIILSAFLLFIHGIAPAQQSQVKYLTLEEVIRLAHENSLQALLAKHRFRNSYWQYRSYKASYLPSVAIQSDLIDMQRAITKNEVFEDGEWVEKYGESQRLNSTMRLEVNQNVPITGGRIFVASELGRLDLLNDEPISFMSTPVSIGFRQPLFGFNSFKWQRQVEPLKYEEAKKQN
jgi:outer membrane protein TolC